MVWIIIFIVVVVIVVANVKSDKKPPDKYIRYPDSIIKSDNERKVRIANGEHDDMYLAYKDHHKWKSLEKIEQYIKEKREESWHYWQDNRLEYKVLMELSREIETHRAEELQKTITSDQVYQLSYTELLEYFRMITYNPHIYKGFNTKQLTQALEQASFEKFHPELITKTPSTALKWINARENAGEYIGNKLKDIAEEMQQKELPDEAYKRQRKNIQSNISKAKKEGDWLKTEELEQKLINLENQKPKI